MHLCLLYKDFLKLVTYLVFFLLVLTFYGLPLNIIRDVYLTARSFYQRCRDLLRYLDATKNMNQRYPNATQAELDEMSDKTCIICREELALRTEPASGTNNAHTQDRQQQGPNMSPKKLLCGHIFHFHCLRSWLERQQSCPTWSVALLALTLN
jgi:E3 ubiquitin-protein ligase synoviolin